MDFTMDFTKLTETQLDEVGSMYAKASDTARAVLNGQNWFWIPSNWEEVTRLAHKLSSEKFEGMGSYKCFYFGRIENITTQDYDYWHEVCDKICNERTRRHKEKEDKRELVNLYKKLLVINDFHEGSKKKYRQFRDQMNEQADHICDSERKQTECLEKISAFERTIPNSLTPEETEKWIKNRIQQLGGKEEMVEIWAGFYKSDPYYPFVAKFDGDYFVIRCNKSEMKEIVKREHKRVIGVRPVPIGSFVRYFWSKLGATTGVANITIGQLIPLD
jgi:hypothetical protein